MTLDTPPLPRVPQGAPTAAQRTARLMLLEAMIIRATSGHGPGGSWQSRQDRARMFRLLGPEHVRQWQLLKGVTALGVPEPVWVPYVIGVLDDLCREGGVPCIGDIPPGIPTLIREAFNPQLHALHPDSATECQAAVAKAARQLAPATDLQRAIATPVLVIRRIPLTYSGSPSAPDGLQAWLDKISDLRELGYRVILLCHDALRVQRRLGSGIDHTLQLRSPGPWVLSRLCNETDKRFIISGRRLAAATPDNLNSLWRPTMSTAIISLLLDELATDQDRVSR